MSSQPQESTLTPSFPGRRDESPAPEDPEASHYDGALEVTRRACLEFSIEKATRSLLLIEIEDLARHELKRIREEIDNNVKSWTLEFYHRKVLETPSHTPKPDTPDAFFGRHAGTKPRLILRLTGKVILHKVRELLSAPRLLKHLISTFDGQDLHSQIEDYIRRWDKNIQLEAAKREGGQKNIQLEVTKPEGGQNKRQRGSKTQTTASKRQLTIELSEESLRPEILSAAHPLHIRDIPQRGIINQAQALPTIASLYPKLSNILPHQNLPSPPTTRQITSQTDHAFHAGPLSYYGNQQNSQNSTSQTEEDHQRLGPQMQQEQEEQQQQGLQMQQQHDEQQQQQDFFDEGVENQWGDLNFDMFFQ